MNAYLTTYRAIVFSIMMAFLLNGCSIAGYMYGRTVDKKKNTVTLSRVGDLETGQKITFRLKTGESIYGVYQNVEFESMAYYSRRYESWLNAHEVSHLLPIALDTLSISLQSKEIVNGRFHGFDRDVLYLATQNGEEAIAVPSIDKITSHTGTPCDLEEIRELNEREELPLRTVIVLEELPMKSAMTLSGVGIRKIDPNTVSHIRLDGKSYAGFVLVGLAIDTLLIVKLIENRNRPPCTGYCPSLF